MPYGRTAVQWRLSDICLCVAALLLDRGRVLLFLRKQQGPGARQPRPKRFRKVVCVMQLSLRVAGNIGRVFGAAMTRPASWFLSRPGSSGSC